MRSCTSPSLLSSMSASTTADTVRVVLFSPDNSGPVTLEVAVEKPEHVRAGDLLPWFGVDVDLQRAILYGCPPNNPRVQHYVAVLYVNQLDPGDQKANASVQGREACEGRSWYGNVIVAAYGLKSEGMHSLSESGVTMAEICVDKVVSDVWNARIALQEVERSGTGQLCYMETPSAPWLYRG
ncbi:hypothetical protein R3P38DRAFT_3175286 [Favolaschia claudopus]|uniref:Uncharacterized protein n=1 Tax=Favolaschia claudopus TaxID=2862362 RepID=A0AAW0DA44_9AGAR